jgi:coenzyme F420-0:L-glutamate ligase / coenzyme F420-1:gamma-L-glutamate ligase
MDTSATGVRSLILTALVGIPTIRSGQELAPIIVDACRRSAVTLQGDDTLVIAQKIVSKSEGRFVRLGEVVPSERACALAAKAEKDPRIVELILQDSAEVLRCVPGVIIVVHRLGFIMANAGIDASNVETSSAEEVVLLLPADPDASAATLRAAMRKATGLDLGIVINDSFGRAWRLGTVGTAIGVAGLPGLLNLRGRPDRTGRLLRTSEVGIADELAAAASLLMGQADEGLPIIHVRGFPHGRRDGNAAELVRPKQLNLFM